ncbi:MAG TPA: 4Fe-4S dicluster domain-containing protein, partial [Polyangia bacterium]
QPPAAHALVHAMNDALGNLSGDATGATVAFTPLVVPSPRSMPGPDDWLWSFDEVVAGMRDGRVDTLLLLDVDPVYTAPADLGFAEALERVDHTFCLAYEEHETARRCRHYAPAAHYLETWGDARAYDGTISMIQPLVAPLVDARSPAEMLAALADDDLPDGQRLTRRTWVTERGLSETDWQRAVQRGLQAGTAEPPVAVSLDRAAVARAVAALPASNGAPADHAGHILELELYPSPTVHDGRFASNPWLLEQPTPIGKLTWDNAALVSPGTARALDVTDEQIVELRASGATVRAPVLTIPGMADGVAAVWLGYGRRQAGSAADGVGFDAFKLRTRAHLHSVPEVRVIVHADRHALALTQEHWSTHDRPIALRASLDEYRRDPTFTEPFRSAAFSMLPEYRLTGHQWAMSIDLSICTGCSSCTVACQAENNWPVVGKSQVRNSREMNWLRIDTYFFGPPEAPRLVHQPMMCQHCEKAPCEYVCPVEATVHSPDGLNEMVYNRCVGTRFCSNNCPYKVRRFNWFDWGERVAMNQGLAELQYNPDVTVRERGVMEKCTYCVQRIRRAGIEARLDARDLRPGEVVTACQAACPTGAIQFGSLAHRDTDMVRWRQQDRAYAVLQQEEGTQPRTMYLARIDNPNRELG